jgi:hypothetical protein
MNDILVLGFYTVRRLSVDDVSGPSLNIYALDSWPVKMGPPLNIYAQDSWPVKMGPIVVPETSSTNLTYTPSKTPKPKYQDH